MIKPGHYLFIAFILMAAKSSCQGVLLSQPRLEIAGKNLLIYNDLVTKNSSDQFYIWVALIPKVFQPLQNAEISLNHAHTPFNEGILLSLKIEF